jgi:hypothetical protein
MNTRYDPDLHHRQSIRLQGYDYRQAGAYLITIVTQDRGCLLGDAVDGTIRLNDAGWMVRTVWTELPAHYPGVAIDDFVVMPNNVHGILVLTSDGPDGGALELAGDRPAPHRATTGGCPYHVVA